MSVLSCRSSAREDMPACILDMLAGSHPKLTDYM